MKVDINQCITSPCYEHCYLERNHLYGVNDDYCAHCEYHLVVQLLKRVLIETSGCRHCLSAVPAEDDHLECGKDCADTCYHDNLIDIGLTNLIEEFCLTEDLNNGVSGL